MPAQKTDAIGQLMGSVAHDFKNILTAILGCADFIAERTQDDPILKKNIEVVRAAALRGVDLTKQLPAVCREEMLKPELTNLNEILPTSISLLEGRAEPTTMPQGEESILVVEDDPDVRSFVVAALEILGYTVFEAEDGRAALCLLDEIPDLDLLLTDVVMPNGMSGRDVADEVQKRYPQVKSLFTSGYTNDALAHHGRLDDGAELLAKPYTRETLARKVRHVLDARTDSEYNHVDFAKAIILIIDDDPGVRFVLTQALEAADLVCLEASDGRQGIKICRDAPVDIVITDIIMPDKDGIETIMEIKRQFPAIKVIAMSGAFLTGPVNYLEMAERLGADRIFPKPLEFSEIVEVVNEFVSGTD